MPHTDALDTSENASAACGRLEPLVSRLPLGRVICGDNCEVMRQWPSQSIDLVVTSPPYDDLRTYGGHSWDFFGVAWNLKRLLKPGGVLVWVVADATKDGSETGTSMEQALHFKRLGLNLHDTMIYANDKPPQNANRYEQKWEYSFVFCKGKPKTANLIVEDAKREGNLVGKFYMVDGTTRDAHTPGKTGAMAVRGNVWWYPTGRVGLECGLHPAMFPFGLARDHIATWSNPGDIILDPFAGSGTTLKAAQDQGRHWVGIEINPEYIPICDARTAQASLDLVSG